MKTKWQFFFETNDFVFREKHDFCGSIPKGAVSSTPAASEEKIDFELSIVPDYSHPHAGSIYVTIPYNYEEGKELVKHVAYVFAQRISFEFGEMKLNTALILCERIPETPEEKELIGDAPYAAEMHLKEVVGSPTFDAKRLCEQSSVSLDSRLLEQHNSARMNPNSIEKFLGFFKIIETLFGPQNKDISLEDALLANATLYDVFTKVVRHDAPELYREEYKKLIPRIVGARHRCAHMRLKKDFGYWISDPRVKDEVEPYLGVLEALAYHAIRGKP